MAAQLSPLDGLSSFRPADIELMLTGRCACPAGTLFGSEIHIAINNIPAAAPQQAGYVIPVAAPLQPD